MVQPCNLLLHVWFECARRSTPVLSWIHMDCLDVLQTASTTPAYRSSSTGFRVMRLRASAVRTLVHGSTCQHDSVDMQLLFDVAF